MEDYIEIFGARTHNLKNINLKIPRGKITALVGVSGSGKTSLAFDTLYAEGYFRYIESISPYIRQFLDKVQKPDVDKIYGLPPAIGLRRKRRSKAPRTTIATATDIYSYLQTLFSAVADFYCPSCQKKVKKYSLDEIYCDLTQRPTRKINICFTYKGDISFLINRGYYFYIENGVKSKIDNTVKNRPILVLVDTVRIDKVNKSRIMEALDKAGALGEKRITVVYNRQQILFPLDLYCPSCGTRYDRAEAKHFAYNSSKGACPSCKGTGEVKTIDVAEIFDQNLSLSQGAVRLLQASELSKYNQDILLYARKCGVDIHTPIKGLKSEDLALLVHGKNPKEGLESILTAIVSASSPKREGIDLKRYFTSYLCPKCQGDRLNQWILSYKVLDKSIAEITRMTVENVLRFIKAYEKINREDLFLKDIIKELNTRLKFLVELGLSYLRLNRPIHSLSSGERQRVNLAYMLGFTLTNVLIVLDQPAADHHPSQYDFVISILKKLKKKGNTVLMIEHNREIVRQADYVVELGPNAGLQGGEVVFSGSSKDFFSSCKTVSQKYFTQIVSLSKKKRSFKKWLKFENVCANNLKHFTVTFPVAAFSIITGASGAGKSSLLADEIGAKTTMDYPKGKIFIASPPDHAQSDVSLASFFDFYSSIREMFARQKASLLLNYTPGHFSLFSPLGRCGTCSGKGTFEKGMQFLPPISLPCPKCNGSGFKEEVLKIKYRDHNIYQIMELTIDDFYPLIGDAAPHKMVHYLEDIRRYGLGYVQTGQKISSLSFGERQKLLMIKYLGHNKRDNLYLMDNPTFGLHYRDIEVMADIIHRLINKHNTIIATDPGLLFKPYCDYIVELGPGGGDDGGYLTCQGLAE